MKGNGYFGKWIIDKHGLPAYDYTCNQYSDPKAKTPTTYGYSIDHFHQLGNDRITATAHNGGHIQVLEASRGFQWLTYRDPKRNKIGGGIGIFQLESELLPINDLYSENTLKQVIDFKRIFGCGYFQKILNLNGIRIEHTICTPFSDDPVLISEIQVKNSSELQKEIIIVDFWDINLHHLLRSLVVTANNRKLFGKSKVINGTGKFLKTILKLLHKDTDGSRKKFKKRFKFKIKVEKGVIILTPIYRKKVSINKEQSAKHNLYPNSIFLSMVKGTPKNFIFDKNQIMKGDNFQHFNETECRKENFQEKWILDPCMGIQTKINIKPKKKERSICVFGYAPENKIHNFIEKYQNIISTTSIMKRNAEEWNKSFIDLKHESFEWLSREIKWHAYYIRSSCYFDEYYGQHRFPQGSIYLFGHGLDGGVRDYILYLIPIILINSKLAKEYLIFILSLMSEKGKLPYSLHGFGKIFTASVHSNPSDLYLFLIWGIHEYISITRDFDFLNIETYFYPQSDNKTATVYEKLELSLKFLFSGKVGVGEHGLIKCNDGDWSDGISLMVNNRKKFKNKGESNFNSTFALYIIPKVIPLLKKYNLEFAELCEQEIINLKASVLETWNGKWFYRGWDGMGNPIGDKNLYLEHHNWLLIAKILKKRRALELIENIYEILDKPSPIGQYISFPAQDTFLKVLPKGWDVNGGIWHAMNALLTWAYSNYDYDKAFTSLMKNSMTQRANSYPNIWYGIWSGPDSYIADYAEDPGEAFYHFTTPMRDFPIMNLNMHACFLLAVIKIVGIKANLDSIEINSRVLDKDFKFISPMLSIENTHDYLSFKYYPINSKNLKIAIKKPKFYKNDTRIILNGKELYQENPLLTIENDYIIIKNYEEKVQIDILLTN